MGHGQSCFYCARPSPPPSVPLWFFSMALTVLRLLPHYRQWSTAMAERMGRDLLFDHSDAARDLDFKPRAFVLGTEDRLP
jgi:hypothetical protein